MWVKKNYIHPTKNMERYKIFLPDINGSGALGETLSSPFVVAPNVCHTETFLSIGNFETKAEADFCLKYIKTKFARVMLGVLKATHHTSPSTWFYVPLQDFTKNSDIDWSKPINEIDTQLYAKYHLTKEEINFIETHVKGM